MADHSPPEPPAANGGPASSVPEPHPPGPGSKRQRRPSIRLGDIDEQPSAVPHEPFVRRSKHSKHSFAPGVDHPRHPPLSNTRHQALLSSAADDRALLPVDENLGPLAISIRRSRDAKAPRSGAAGRRARWGWTSSMVDEGIDAAAAELKSSGTEDAGEEGCRNLRAEDSESPSDRTTPALRVRVLETKDVGPNGVAMEGDVPSENNSRGDWNDHNQRCRLLQYDGVRPWLSRLNLNRYAPVFEIHEVDDEVLPLLTMEDLKDMGINAVGSRRKMYCAIQKLKKGSLQEPLRGECS